jgi:hypothetical protein
MRALTVNETAAVSGAGFFPIVIPTVKIAAIVIAPVNVQVGNKNVLQQAIAVAVSQ